MAQNLIYSINGPVVTIKGKTGLSMMEMVHVGNDHLVGEVIRMDEELTTIQVYEETSGLAPGEPVTTTGGPLCVTLGPGILRNIYDGIQRPLPALEKESGPFIARGCNIPSLDPDAKWDVTVTVKVGDKIVPGQIYATCPETPVILHKCMAAPGMEGTVTWVVENGSYTVNDTVVRITDKNGNERELTLCQKWPIRRPRPVQTRMPAQRPLITGMRVVDTMFPIAKGGAAAIPGGFGTGKTMTQHQLAKWCDADIIIYVGSGERGNEMTQALTEFGELIDPKTGRPLTDRTVLIANTSNMPVAAREASIYTGITIAEYFRDMGYDVAVIADSTSRWAEALREMSGRLEEMPGEEGYPAYLASRLAQFYERAGCVECLGADERRGSLTAIGAVSPPGGDISEPVSQATMRIVKVFWGLDASLAYARHFPAINWLTSYSLYLDTLRGWCDENLGRSFMLNRGRAMALLQKEAELQEIVKLVGQDALSPADNLTLESAKMIREDFLQQNAFLENDQYSSFDRQARLLELILRYKDLCDAAIARGADIWKLYAIAARAAIGRAKTVPAERDQDVYAQIEADMEQQIEEVAKEAEAE